MKTLVFSALLASTALAGPPFASSPGSPYSVPLIVKAAAGGGDAPTFFGASPAGGETGDTGLQTLTITPPASMTLGQLVVVVAYYRGNAGTSGLTVTGTGGQSWTGEDAYADGGATIRFLWCTFNGTWSADPTFDSSVDANTFRAGMMVFTLGGATWTRDVATAGADFGIPGTPADVTMTGVTTTAANTIIIGAFGGDDDNTWTLQTGGWNAPVTDGWGSIGGADGCVFPVYRIQASAGASGSCVARQIDLAPDRSSWANIAIRPTP